MNARRWRAEVLGTLVVAASSFAAPTRDGGFSIPGENAACLECHSDETMDTELENEELVPLYVDKKQLAASVHADVDCTECHVDLKGKGEKHEGAPLPTRRDYAIKFSEQCKDCHFQNYTKMLDSVHHQVMVEGKKEAAVCTDCHGAHAIGKASEPRSRISKACATCHEKIAEQYSKSVHGAALLAEENPDVPTCTDCHHAHEIADPRTPTWRLDSPQMCGGCHSDERVMKKYGLSTNVLSSYLADFHGSTTTLEKANGDVQKRTLVAVCTDCHGVHDIMGTKDPHSKVMQANLVKTCRECHKDATDSFPAAWLSHYEPTFEKAPLVYLVNLFYAVLIPFMIAGIVLQIALHLWRMVVNR